MKELKKDFDIYNNNKNLVYLDYAATTFMPKNVISSWVNYHKNIGVSCSRGNGRLTKIAYEEYESSKKKILDFFDAYSNYDIIFGKNATECINILSNSIKELLKPGDIILLSPYEHHSNLLPWNMIANISGACVVQLPLKANGEIDYDFTNFLDKKRIKVISMTMISNVNSHLLDIEWFKNFIKDSKIFSILDVTQATGHKKMSFEEISADAYVMSAHKMYGPKNLGAAIVRKDKIEKINPLILGGGMVWNSLGETPKWSSGSKKFEAGTFDVGLIKAWSVACEYLNNVGFDAIEENDRSLWEYLKKKLNNKKIKVVPGGSKASALCSFEIAGIHPHDIEEKMIENNIEIRTGHMCAQGVLNFLGFTTLCRISWGIGTAREDIDKFLIVLEEILK